MQHVNLLRPIYQFWLILNSGISHLKFVYERFKKIVEKLNFSPIKISTSLDEAAELILKDRKHLDNNPKPVTKKDIMKLLDGLK